MSAGVGVDVGIGSHESAPAYAFPDIARAQNSVPTRRSTPCFARAGD
jgi:hypothetical protein